MRLILTLVLAALPLLILADDPPYTVHCTDENQTCKTAQLTTLGGGVIFFSRRVPYHPTEMIALLLKFIG
ncbi:uncharacterized protein PGTG_07058 [Puccinia graminis f. sp. tritici CRL 75-36-700-3]|uniref:Uncharacterized protein n=1 Tax=Puccinia graminis f. sp. tritici (strain CRL 75-36-700-3 / race SCCL) TaxID=418459 RepID=E3KAN0_PUCGT|nr:uncharacterized protein PGTG_07058 [Puccinia graminis f. sp. tritici CRL 75-36-700-3]EFP81437.2 hypothetical protein PGTG_07058 [Puccinia graminis f. sp. tritici CRL 75-36-700-3]